ncbi:MAG: fasciclin domain-containing protein, partial [Stackebrandtia sp.]
ESKSKDDSGKMDEPFGAACADVPKDGKGSFDGMAEDPVATAASNNKELSTLVEAVGEADLVDTLNSTDNLTVFAPANSAFEKIPEKDLTALLKDKDMLTDVLTYHVLDKKVAPDKLGTDGPFTSLQGAEVTASGSGEDFTINDEAKVACGNVQTSNATVYIIDTVLMPPAK